jgi:hypothetical protein
MCMLMLGAVPLALAFARGCSNVSLEEGKLLHCTPVHICHVWSAG